MISFIYRSGFIGNLQDVKCI